MLIHSKVSFFQQLYKKFYAINFSLAFQGVKSEKVTKKTAAPHFYVVKL